MQDELNDLLYIITIGLGFIFLIIMLITISWAIGEVITERFL